MTAKPEVWYRVDNRSYSVSDEWGEHSYSCIGLVWREYEVIKHTPKGVWVKKRWDSERWVSNSARKRLCYPTKELALRSLIARKERQVSIYQARIDGANFAAKLAANEIKKLKQGTPHVPTTAKAFEDIAL